MIAFSVQRSSVGRAFACQASLSSAVDRYYKKKRLKVSSRITFHARIYLVNMPLVNTGDLFVSSYWSGGLKKGGGGIVDFTNAKLPFI